MSTIKLSTAILKGCKGTRKCSRAYFRGEKTCCALGAALRGTGFKNYKISEIGVIAEVEKRFKGLENLYHFLLL